MTLELFDVFTMLTIKFIQLFSIVSVIVVGGFIILMMIWDIGSELYYRWWER